MGNILHFLKCTSLVCELVLKTDLYSVVFEIDNDQ